MGQRIDPAATDGQLARLQAKLHLLGFQVYQQKRPVVMLFEGWDAAGAKTFGYPTFWVNRAGAAVEELEITPDGAGATLADLATFVTSDRG